MTKIYKNHAQLGHYYIVDEEKKRMAEVVQGSEAYLYRVEDFEGTRALLEHEIGLPPGWHYDFEESTFLDILVVTGVTEERINEVMEVSF